jgi:hypothetical protein
LLRTGALARNAGARRLGGASASGVSCGAGAGAGTGVCVCARCVCVRLHAVRDRQGCWALSCSAHFGFLFELLYHTLGLAIRYISHIGDD